MRKQSIILLVFARPGLTNHRKFTVFSRARYFVHSVSTLVFQFITPVLLYCISVSCTLYCTITLYSQNESMFSNLSLQLSKRTPDRLVGICMGTATHVRSYLLVKPKYLATVELPNKGPIGTRFFVLLKEAVHF